MLKSQLLVYTCKQSIGKCLLALSEQIVVINYIFFHKMGKGDFLLLSFMKFSHKNSFFFDKIEKRDFWLLSFMKFSHKNASAALAKLNACLHDVQRWMSLSKLKLV